MAYDLKAVLSLKDDMSAKLKRVRQALRDTREASDTYRDANGRLRDAQGRFVASTAVATTGLIHLTTITNSATLSITGLAGAFAMATAAAAPLAAAVGGISSSLAAAATGAGAFGVVAVSSLTDIFEAAEEVEKINERIAAATTATEYANAQNDLKFVYDQLSSSQIDALENLQSFQDYWGTFKSSFDEPIFEAFAGGLRATQSLLEGLRPTIASVAEVTTGVISRINQAMANGTTNNFFAWLEENAARSIENFATVAGNAFLGFTNILNAFAPTGARLENSLVSISERFREWSDTLATSQGFQQFMDYANQNGQTLLSLFSNLTTIAGQTAATLAPFGTVLLSAFEKATGFIVDNWPVVRETIIGVTAAVVAFKAASAGLLIYTTITSLMAAYAKVAGTMTVAQWALNVALNANPIGLITAGIAAAVGAGVLLYRNFDSIREKALELWDAFGGWKTALLGLLGPIGMMINGGRLLYESWKPFKDLVDGVKDGWNKLTGGGTTKEETGSSSGANNSWLFGGEKPKTDGYNYNGISKVPYNGFVSELHKDEKVLTARQAKAYDEGGGGNTVNLTINYSGGPKLGEAEMELFSSYLVRRINQAGGGGA